MVHGISGVGEHLGEEMNINYLSTLCTQGALWNTVCISRPQLAFVPGSLFTPYMERA